MIQQSLNQTVKAVILLEDGTHFWGKAAGKIGTTSGEICFNTGMTGYQEIYTDPSYFGQIVVNTNCHIGNYGVKNSDTESKSMKIAGMVCRDFSKSYSRIIGDSNINDYFTTEEVVAISDVDTRAIVKYIRDKGAMNAIISSEILDIDELKKLLKAVPSMEGLELSSKVTTDSSYLLGNEDDYLFKVAVLDYGVKSSILNNFVSRGCLVKVFPYKSDIKDIQAWNPDGYFLSNGPGDPSAMNDAVELVKQVLATEKPLFGICLGHQLLALALGINTYKMHNGHRGLNHPVINLRTGKCEITSQNHGFSVEKESVLNNEFVEVTHINLNDDTIEGIKHKTLPAFSVQYHPEAGPGPHDSHYLFDEFIDVLKKYKV